MTDLDKAREWADWTVNQEVSDGVRAAVNTVHSLQDQFIDAEKVKELIDIYTHARDANGKGTEGWMMNHLVVSNLESLLPVPSLPTLADMTQEERAACQWMQADVQLSTPGNNSVKCVIADPRAVGAKVRVWAPHGGSDDIEADRVTPLPDLPKLEWPGGVADEEIVEGQEEPKPYLFGVTSSESDLPDISVSERIERTESSIKPEGVPPNEPWLIEVGGRKAIGARYQGDAHAPWAVAVLNGSFASDYTDHEVTLIHKLVPETHALPEGMRLADHEEYGRVVVSPAADVGGDYKIFHLDNKNNGRATYRFASPDDLTFLDGDQHA